MATSNSNNPTIVGLPCELRLVEDRWGAKVWELILTRPTLLYDGAGPAMLELPLGTSMYLPLGVMQPATQMAMFHADLATDDEGRHMNQILRGEPVEQDTVELADIPF